MTKRYDLLITNARIYDGSGNPWFYGSVAVNNGSIAAIGGVSQAKATIKIDAQGQYLCPGFIDMHTHADANLSRKSSMEQYLRQGVTTIIGGNCGSSRYPISSHLRTAARLKKRLNYGLLLGHGTLRKQILGSNNRSPSDSELRTMRRLCAKALTSGALGLSFGLYYSPGCYAESREINALAAEAQKYNGLLAFHLRDEGNYGKGLIESVQEAISVASYTGARVHISHLKCLGKAVWGKSTDVLKLLDSAREQGLDISFDQYPYAASSTSLRSSLMPRWVYEENADLNIVAASPRLLQDVNENIVRRGGAAQLVIASYPADTSINGMSLADLSSAWSMSPAEAAVKLQTNGGARLVSFNMSEVDVRRIMMHPLGIVASDGSLIETGDSMPHPRSYGTFPRVLARYVREQHVISLSEAIRKMTSAPATRLGLNRRGLIAPGLKADLTMFSLKDIADNATFTQPHQYATGVLLVVVNGKIALQNTRATKAYSGYVLRR